MGAVFGLKRSIEDSGVIRRSQERAPLRILIVSPYPIEPPIHGGRLRALGLARGLARSGAMVDLLEPWVPGRPRERLLEPGLMVHSHALVGNVLPFLISDRLVPPLALLSLQPLWAGPRQLLLRFQPDIVQFEFCAQFNWAGALKGNPLIAYSAHNVERDYNAQQPGIPVIREVALRRIERFERKAVQSSDVLISSSDPDEARLKSLYGEPRCAIVIENGFDADLLAFRPDEWRERARAALGIARDLRVLLFVGGDAAHNREAVRYLVNDLCPRLPDSTRLLIVGRCADAAGTRAHPHIQTLHFVDDLKMVFAAADIALNPVTFGGGTNVKLAEYVAAGVPVLSTPFGLRGVPHLAHRVSCAPREEFARALQLIPNRLEYDRSELVPFSWDSLGRKLFNFYSDVIAERKVNAILSHRPQEHRL